MSPDTAKDPVKKAAKIKEDNERRGRQAAGIRKILRTRFPGTAFNNALFAVVGDLNDEPASTSVRPIVQQAGLADVLDRIPKLEDRWTHWFRSENTVSQLDYVLLSPALDKATAGAQPRIERRGISFRQLLADGKPGPKTSRFLRKDEDPNPIPVGFRFERFAEVSSKDYASDHCPVFFAVP